MNAEQLNAIKERAAKATTGPWYYEVDGDLFANGETVLTPFVTKHDIPILKMKNDDATFLAHAREDVPALVAEVEQLQAEIERVDALYSEKYILTTHYKNQAYEQALEIERLRKALEYFADNENYLYASAGECAVLENGRQIAREALRIGEESNAL